MPTKNKTPKKNINEQEATEKVISTSSGTSGGFLVGPATPHKKKVDKKTKDFERDAAIVQAAMTAVMDGLKDEADLDEFNELEEYEDLDSEVEDVVFESHVHQQIVTNQESDEVIPVISASTIRDEPVQEAVLDTVDLNEVFYEPVLDETYRDSNYKAVDPVNVPRSVPNYHKPDYETSKICSTCKFFTADEGNEGQCSAYSFVAEQDYTCDSWAATEVETNGVDSTRNPILDEDGNIVSPPAQMEVKADIPESADVPNDLPDKYKDIDFTVSKEMAENAKQALEIRSDMPESKQGMTPVGMRRAIQLAKREAVAPDTWRRMLSYFERHEIDKEGSSWDEKGKGWQAWQGWGGDAAFRKAKRVVVAMDRADESATAKTFKVSMLTVKEWANKDCPSDILNKELYKSIRSDVRRDVTERGTQWGAYDSLKLRKKYYKELESESGKSHNNYTILSDNELLESIEAEIMDQGGVIARKMVDNTIMGYDETLGTYSAPDLKNWLSGKWVDTSQKIHNGYAECVNSEDIKSGCIPESKADDFVGVSKSKKDSQKIVDCSEIPEEERKNYPECEEHKDGVDPESRPYYGTGYDFNNIDTPHNDDDVDDEPVPPTEPVAPLMDSAPTSSSEGSATAMDDLMSIHTKMKLAGRNGVKSFGKVRYINRVKDVEPTSELTSEISDTDQYAHDIKGKTSLGQTKGQPFYLPGDRVYSKTCKTLAEVRNSSVVNGENLYSIRMIDKFGSVHGYAVVHETDLTPRSMRAIKRMQVKASRGTIENHMKVVIRDLQDIKDEHKDYQNNPIPVEKIDAVEERVKNLLANKDFDEASSEMKMRKYVRAMQDIEHSLSAAGHLIRNAQEISDEMDNEGIKNINEHTQRNVYDRVMKALSRAEESLMVDTPMRSYRRDQM